MSYFVKTERSETKEASDSSATELRINDDDDDDNDDVTRWL